MKRTGILAALLISLCTVCSLCASCGRDVHGLKLRNADLLFVRIPSDYELGGGTMSDAIAESTSGSDSSRMTVHVAILEVAGDSTFVIDATIKRGVARYQIDTFLTDFRLRDGSLPVLEVKRPDVSAGQARKFVENAKKYIGQPYDVHFLPDNGAMYCSELVYNAYILPDGTHLFNERPMNFLSPDGQMPQYWIQLFALLDQEVPQGVPGTNPQTMSEEPVLREVGRIAE